MAKRKQTVSDGCLRVLRKMRTAEKHLNCSTGEVEAGDDELIQSVPGGWWLGSEQISGRIGMALLRDCLISQEDGSREGYWIYTLNSDGRRIADDHTIEPPIRKLAANNIGRFAF